MSTASAGAAGAGRPDLSGVRVAYVMSRFPKLTETFILLEMSAVERLGAEVEVYPLLRERTSLVHPEAAPLVERAHFIPFLSPAVLRSHLHFLLRRPRAYLGGLWALLAGTWGSANFFVGALGIIPKVVHAARLMEADGVTHVHCHFATHPAAAGFLIRRLTGIPYSFTVHGSDLHVDRHMLPQKVAEAAFVVPISAYNRDVIEAECGPVPEGRLEVIHCGVDPDAFAPTERDAAGPFTVVCVGTLHEVKGQTHLVEACRLLAQEGVDVACVLVGDGPDREDLAAQAAEAGIADRVRFAGRLTSVEVADEVGRADVLVAPSVPTAGGKREGIPVVLMEAMSTAMPVVASRLSGIPELVEDGRNGLLVPPGDAKALAGALHRLHDDAGLRRRLGAQGRATVQASFDLTTNAARLARRFTRAS